MASVSLTSAVVAVSMPRYPMTFLLDCLDRRSTDDATSRVPDGRHSYVGQARLAYVRVATEARRSVSEIRTEATRARCGYARFLASRGRVRTSQRYRRWEHPE